jgi:hypothetical protein
MSDDTPTTEQVTERPLTDLPDEYVYAYVPDGFGLDFEAAAAIALQVDKNAADALEAQALELLSNK